MKRSPIRRSRRGATTVEFAMTLPIFLLIMFSSLDFMRASNLKHTAENAAYEAARLGIVPGATADQVEAEAKRIMQTLMTLKADVTVTPSVIDENTSEVTVDVDVPMNKNGLMSPFFFKNRTLNASMTMRRELFSQTNVK